MIDASLTTDINFSQLENDARFQVVRALSRTARDASQQIGDGIGDVFTIRRAWIKKGMRYEKATMNSMRATVFHRDSFLKKQEYGAAETPHGKHFAIPAQIRSSERSSIPRSRMPRKVLDRPNTFKGTTDKGAGIFQRARGKKLRLLYLLTKKKTTEPRWGFEETVERVVENRFAEHFQFGD